MKLDFNMKLETKAYQLYEITQVKSGCIILGDFMSGKTTLINLLAAALNRASHNELKLRVAEKRRENMLNIAKDHKVDEEAASPTKIKGRGQVGFVDPLATQTSI
jgi:nicotinamide riboside kinase